MKASRRNIQNQAFECVECGVSVSALDNGSYRNHCPECLCSLHVDGDEPGDRLAGCAGVMRASALIRGKKGLQIVHVCSRCGAIRRNKVAELTSQPDSWEKLVRLPWAK